MKWIVRLVFLVPVLIGAFLAIKFFQYQNAMEAVSAGLPGDSRIVETSVGPVEYLVQGNSDNHVMLIHGTPGSYRTFMADVLVEEGFTVISPSRPGYFRTPLSSGDGIAEQADLYAALMDELGIESAAIIGFSGGGPSALSFASRHPDRCSGLVVMAASGRAFPAPPPSFIETWLMGSEFGRWMAYTTLSQSFAEDRFERALGYVNEAFFPMEYVIPGEENDFAQFDSDWNVELDTIKCPTLIIHGTEDELIPFSEATYLSQQIANSTLVSKAGQDHFTVVFFEFGENLKVSADFLNSN